MLKLIYFIFFESDIFVLVENEINIESVSLWATTKGDGKESFSFFFSNYSYTYRSFVVETRSERDLIEINFFAALNFKV